MPVCHGKWMDHGEPVCEAHGYLWEDGQTFCNGVQDSEREALEAILSLHTKHEHIMCGVQAKVPHQHSREPGTMREPYPERVMTCSEKEGHEGPHKDTICCWRFERFDSDKPEIITGQWPLEKRDFSSCTHCQTSWPCATVSLIVGG